MNQKDIQELQAIRQYPSVSILLPTYRRSPEDLQQNPVRVKNLVRQAIDRLLKEFSKRDIQPLLQQLDELTEQIDFNSPKDGLALFANAETARLFYLPFTLPERVVVDETFATRHLIHARNRTKRYWTLVLNQDQAKLYECERDSFQEVDRGAFPMHPEAPGVVTEWSSGSGFGRDEGKYDTKSDQLFFQHVDRGLTDTVGTDPLPIAVVGVERNISYFKNLSRHANNILTTVDGNYEKLPLRDLIEKVWPAVREAFSERRNEVWQAFEQSAGSGRVASGIQDIWRLAHEGRVDTILVEENFSFAGTVDESGFILTPAADPTAPGVMDDAVDTLVEAVVERSGKVVFFDSGALDQHQHVAAILRY